jgi:LytS/YehU family sensor histidine kinase
MICAYVSMDFILPRFIETKKYLKGAVAFTILFSAGTVINYFAATIYYANWGLPLTYSKSPVSLGYLNTIWAMIISVIALGLRITRKWYLQQKEIEEITRQKARNELELQKNSMQPDFLYSSLHSIYENLNESSNSSSSMILVLSNLLSYSLYESKTERVSLQLELNAVNDFINLELMKGCNEIQLEVDEAIDTDEVLIHPMAVLSVMQNGIIKFQREEKGKCKMKVIVSENRSDLRVKVFVSATEPDAKSPAVFIVPKIAQKIYEPA